jgi:hypothetical protein
VLTPDTPLVKQVTREEIQCFQRELAKYEQIDTTTEHYFAPGMYGRKYVVRGDAFVVGRIHRHAHIVMLMSGRCRINTDRGMEDITGPHVWISPVGAKRALYTYTECTFFTCHATDETDLDKLEVELIEPEADPFESSEQKELR